MLKDTESAIDVIVMHIQRLINLMKIFREEDTDENLWEVKNKA